MSDLPWPDRYFYNPSENRIYIVKQNPCRCHPCDLLVEWGKRFNDAALYSFSNDLEIEEFLAKWVEL